MPEAGGTGTMDLGYAKVAPKQYPARGQRDSREGRFWRSYGSQHLEQQFGAVSAVDFSPVAPYDFAISTSTRVIVHSGVTREPKRTISRFSDVAYSGRFRSDGKLLVAGGESGLVQVFDASSRLVLRKLPGHKGAVHATRFCADKVRLVSGGDDACVRLWDMASQEAVSTFTGHSDYVRSLANSRSSPDLWASGSYDHSVRLWDTRTSESVMLLPHGQPVEDVVFFPGGTLVATAGNNYVCIWDILSGPARRLFTLSNHQKTVTCLCISPAVSRGPANRPLPPRLITGSLDCHVKMFDPDTCKVVHASLYGAPILSLGMSANASTLAVGTSSGLLAVRHRKLPKRAESALMLSSFTPRVPGLQPRRRRSRSAASRPLRPSNFRYFLRGRNEKAAAQDFLVLQRRRLHLAAHDRLLRRFRYSEALTSSLESGRPEVVAAVVEELASRGGLTAAISTRNDTALVPLLSFLSKHLCEPRHTALLLPVASKVLDLCSSRFGVWPAVDQQVMLLRRRVAAELRTQEMLVALQGMLLPLLRASASIMVPV